MTENIQAVIADKLSDRGQIMVQFAGRKIALAGEALKTHQGIGKGDTAELTIEKDDKGVAHITGIKKSTVPGTDEALKTPEETGKVNPTGPIINANNDQKAMAQAKAPVTVKKDPLSNAPVKTGDPVEVQPSVIIPDVKNEPQVIIHRQEGTDQYRPDSITFADSTKTPGLKIYVDFKNHAETMDLIDEAFVGYSHALNSMMKFKEENPQLFPDPKGAKA